MSHDSESQGRTQPATISADLFVLSRDMRDRLPQELRDMIYDFVFDPATVKDAHDCAFSTYQGTTAVPPASWPNFLNPANVDELIRHELVVHFCKLNTNMQICHPIDMYLHSVNEMFGTSVRLRPHMLPALTVCLRFTPAEAFKVEFQEMCDYLTRMGQRGRKLAHSFVLTLRIDTDVFGTFKSHHRDRFQAREAYVKRFVSCMQEIHSLLCGVKKAYEEFYSRRKVVLLIRAETLDKTVTFNVHEHMMAWDARAWWDHGVSQLR